MNRTLPKLDKDNITLKDVFEKLKDSTAKQRIAEQKATKLSKELEEERKKIRAEKSCIVCKDAIIEMTRHTQNIAEDAQAIRDMSITGKDRKRMKDGLTYTIDDLAARIERNKCYVQKSLEKYDICCKEMKLPNPKGFKC